MWSGDATTTPDELDEAVRASGVDVLCITDHGTVNGALALLGTGQLPCRIVVGQELRTWAGELIGLFLTERLPYGIKPDEAVARMRAQRGPRALGGGRRLSGDARLHRRAFVPGLGPTWRGGGASVRCAPPVAGPHRALHARHLNPMGTVIHPHIPVLHAIVLGITQGLS